MLDGGSRTFACSASAQRRSVRRLQAGYDSRSRHRSQFWSQLSPFATVRADVGTPAVRSAHPRGRLETQARGLGSGLGSRPRGFESRILRHSHQGKRRNARCTNRRSGTPRNSSAEDAAERCSPAGAQATPRASSADPTGTLVLEAVSYNRKATEFQKRSPSAELHHDVGHQLRIGLVGHMGVTG